MRNVVIFGNSQTAELAKFYLETDSNYEVAAFVISDEYKQDDEFLGKPLVALSTVAELYPVDSYYFFAPMTATNMNQDREGIYNQAKAMGYQFISYVSSKATVLTQEIGENCFILEDNTIQPRVKIGNNCVLWSGNHIGHHSVISDNVFFTSHVVLSGNCTVSDNCFFGVNATVRDFAVLNKGTLIGMGAVFGGRTSKEWGIYTGNPATLNQKRKSFQVM